VRLDDPHWYRSHATLLEAAEKPPKNDLSPVASVATSVIALCSEGLKEFRTAPQTERAIDRGCRWLLKRAASQEGLRVEEEPFVRSGIADRWRHLTLPLAVSAIAMGDTGRGRAKFITDNRFKSAFKELCDRQETAVGAPNRGGWRTSTEGFFTVYAATKGLAALRAVDQAAREGAISPADAMIAVMHAEGAGRNDPQIVLNTSRVMIIVNYWSALLAAIIVSFLGVGIIAFSFVGHPSDPDQRIIRVVVTLIVSLAWSLWAVTWKPRLRGSSIAVHVILTIVAVVASTVLAVA
jgi:hypothetical protein